MKERLYYFLMIVVSIVLGLASRYFSHILPLWVNLYFGDIMYGLMFYFIFAFIFIDLGKKKILIISILYCLLIEFSQIYQADWINNIRTTSIGHLILGRGFLVSDLISYVFGNLFGYILDTKVKNGAKT